MFRLIFLPAAVLFTIGCSDSPSTVTIEERDGVTHALNRQGWNVWSDSTVAPLHFEREQIYGTNEGSGPAFLGGIRGVAIDLVGTVYVLDAPDAHLRRSRNDAAEEVVYATSLDLFEANGRYVGSHRWENRRHPPVVPSRSVRTASCTRERPLSSPRSAATK